MIENLGIVMVVISTLVMVLIAIATLIIYLNFKERNNALFKILAKLFFFYTLYLSFSIIATWISFNNELLIKQGINELITFPFSSALASDPFLIGYSIFYTLDLTFASLTSIIAFKFRLKTFEKQVNPNVRLTHFIERLGKVCFILAIFVLLSINNIYLAVVGGLITFHLFLVYGSFTKDAFQTYRSMKASEEDITYTRAFLYIGLMPLFFIMRNIALYLDQLILFISGVEFPAYSQHSEFYFIAWIFLIFAYVVAYMGYIRPGQKKNREK